MVTEVKDTGYAPSRWAFDDEVTRFLEDDLLPQVKTTLGDDLKKRLEILLGAKSEGEFDESQRADRTAEVAESVERISNQLIATDSLPQPSPTPSADINNNPPRDEQAQRERRERLGRRRIQSPPATSNKDGINALGSGTKSILLLATWNPKSESTGA